MPKKMTVQDLQEQTKQLQFARDRFIFAAAALTEPGRGNNLGIAVMCATEGLVALVAADRSGSGQRWAYDRVRRRMAKAKP